MISKKFILSQNIQAKEIGLLFLRVGIGIIFVNHGLGKLMGGPQLWQSVGSTMSNLGITFGFVFWGAAAACAEFFGGCALILGLATRIATLFMSCVMIVALVMHLSQGDPFKVFSHPLSIFIVFISLHISGSGKYSFDNYLLKKGIEKKG